MQIMPYDPSRKQSRGQHSPIAIVLHEVNEPMTSIDAMMQQPISFATNAHRSFHYAVDGSSIHAYVPLDEAVHAIADTDTMTPWPIALANPGVDVDLYTINIAVSIGTLAPMPDPCTPNCGRNYSVTLQHNIQVLLNKIASIRDINITAANVVWKHGTELCDLDIAPLLLPLPTVTPGNEDWLCDRLNNMPPGDSNAPQLIGSDCATYTPQQVVTASGLVSNCNAQAPNGAFLMRPFGGIDLELNNLLALGVDACAKFVLVNVIGLATTNPGGFYVTTSLPDGTLSINTPVPIVGNSKPSATFVLPVTNGQYKGLLQGGDGMPEEGYADEIRLTVLGWW